MILKLVLSLCVAVLFLDGGLAATELLKNHDMEIVSFSGNWACKGGCTLQNVRDHFSGYHSMKVTNR